jgi:hypothetical protein
LTRASLVLALLGALALAGPAHAAGDAVVPKRGASYGIGTRLTGPCRVGSLPASGAPGQTATRDRVVSVFMGHDVKNKLIDLHKGRGRFDQHEWYVAPDDGCRPLTVRTAGDYSVESITTQEVYRWCKSGDCEYEDTANPPYKWRLIDLNDIGTTDVSFQVSSLRADAGGPYTVVRGGKVKLDGSRSRPKRRIRSYRWSFEPGAAGCEPRRNAEKQGVRASAVVLCNLRATLTVRDEDGESAEASTTITVRKRAWKTPVTHVDDRRQTTPFAAPRVDVLGDGRGEFPPVTFGANWCRPDHMRMEVGGPLHPHGRRLHGTWLRHGYTIEEVSDRGGPFDGRFYTASTELTLDREGVYNQWFLPGGGHPAGADANWYAANRRRNVRVDEILAAIGRHEGLGTRNLTGSGHTQRLQEYVRSKRDPSREIEHNVATSRRALQDDNDDAIDEIHRELTEYAYDPLPVAGSFASAYYVWSEQLKDWILAPEYLF